MSILVVDDDEDDYFLTHAILVDVYGDRIDVDWISSYEAAIEALLSGRYGLCLLDFNLGARSGLDLLRDVLSRGCRTPIIMLTGTADWEVDVKTMEAGAADYLVKGQFSGQQLERAIRYAIGFAVERHQTLDALRRSEERYALAVRGANDGLWDWDLTTDRIYYAPRWKAMIGYEDEEIGDSILEWFNRVNPLDVDRVKAEVSNHLAGKTSHLETEHRMLHHDGTYRWVLTRGLAVRNARGRSSEWRVRSPTSRRERWPSSAAARWFRLVDRSSQPRTPVGPSGPGHCTDEATARFSVRRAFPRHRRLQAGQRQLGPPDRAISS